MNREDKKIFLLSGISLLVFIIFTLLVKFVNVQALGPEGSEIGLAFLNKPFMFKYNEPFDFLSDILLYLTILIVVVCAIIGLTQWVKRKSIMKVDKNILSIPLSLILMVLFVIFFEVVIINYRPIILEEGLEASYPSTHTTLIFTILLITIPVFNNLLNKNYQRIAIFVLYLVIALLALVFRVLSGVHYFTDILGGIFLALTISLSNKSFEILLNKFHKE